MERDKRVHESLNMDRLSAYALNCGGGGGGGWWRWQHKREHWSGTGKRSAVGSTVYGGAGREYVGGEAIGSSEGVSNWGQDDIGAMAEEEKMR